MVRISDIPQSSTNKQILVNCKSTCHCTKEPQSIEHLFCLFYCHKSNQVWVQLENFLLIEVIFGYSREQNYIAYIFTLITKQCIFYESRKGSYLHISELMKSILAYYLIEKKLFALKIRCDDFITSWKILGNLIANTHCHV